MDKTVLITGGAGFIGSHLCRQFIDRGARVICLDNLLTGDLDNIEDLFSEPGFKFIEMDVTGFIHVPGPVDYIMHFASPASPLDYLKYPIQTLKVGALGTHKTLGLAREKKSRFLLASTSEIYGDPAIHPQPETYFGNVNPIGPRGVYDEAKRFAEAMTMAYQRYHGLETRIVRIFNTYGPRMRVKDGRVIPAFLSQAIQGEPLTIAGDGSQTRSFCFIDDTVDGIIRLLESDITTPVNIGNPVEFTILQLAESIKRLFGHSAGIEHYDLPQDDPKVRQPDISQAREALGWYPSTSLDDGLRKTHDYFQRSLCPPKN